jgi:hypothetical protein
MRGLCCGAYLDGRISGPFDETVLLDIRHTDVAAIASLASTLLVGDDPDLLTDLGLRRRRNERAALSQSIQA